MRKFLNPGLLVFGLFLVFIFLLNSWTPFFMDDYGYGILGVSVDRVGTVLNAWVQTWRDGHRPIVHFFLRVFSGVTGKPLFNVCNTAMMGMLVLLVLRLAKGKWTLSFPSIALTIALVYLILCKGESYLWCAGSLNYLWAGCGMLAFMLIRDRLDHDALSWRKAIVFALPVLLIGWAQEAFSMPMCFALGLYYLAHWQELKAKKFFVFACFGVGALFLGLEAIRWVGPECRSASPMQGFSVIKLALTFVKIVVAVKAFWLVLLLIGLQSDRKSLLKRNAFELLVAVGSILMILVVGFYGERSLWPVNLVSIVILVREISIRRRMAVSLTLLMLVVAVSVSVLAMRIRSSFDRFEEMYLASSDGVTIHEWVYCGPFARFFFQAIYTWQTAGYAPLRYALYHGRTTPPKAFSERMYKGLFVENSICTEANRLPIAGAYYTTPEINAIVMPINQGPGHSEYTRVRVDYAPPSGIVDTLKRLWAQHNPPAVSEETHPVMVSTKHGKFLLISKRTASEGYIRSVTIEGQ